MRISKTALKKCINKGTIVYNAQKTKGWITVFYANILSNNCTSVMLCKTFEGENSNDIVNQFCNF